MTVLKIFIFKHLLRTDDHILTFSTNSFLGLILSMFKFVLIMKQRISPADKFGHPTINARSFRIADIKSIGKNFDMKYSPLSQFLRGLCFKTFTRDDLCHMSGLAEMHVIASVRLYILKNIFFVVV